MKKLGIGSVLEINGDFVKVEKILTKSDDDGFVYFKNSGFHKHYIKFENDPNPIDIKDFESCEYNVVSV